METRNASLEKLLKEKATKNSSTVSHSNQNINEFASLMGVENKTDRAVESNLKVLDKPGQESSSESSSQIINVLQSQRDRYKEKLHMVRILFLLNLFLV